MSSIRPVIAPACWANALVNGDQSGLTTDDVIALNAWREKQLDPGDTVVGIMEGAEAYSSSSYWRYDPRSRTGDLIVYNVLGDNDGRVHSRPWYAKS